MLQAEQSGNAIFESKPVDLEEWETTLTVILPLLICRITLTKCVSWNEPCNKNTRGRRSKAPRTKTRAKEERTLKRATVLRNQLGKEVLTRAFTFSPLSQNDKSLQDQKSISWWTAQEGRPLYPFATSEPTPFLSSEPKHTLVLEKITRCSWTQQVLLLSHFDWEPCRTTLVKGSDLNHFLHLVRQ